MKRVLASSLMMLALAVSTACAADDAESLKGKAAPDFTFKSMDGKDLKLSDQKGKVVVVDTWATWCPPCRESLPHIQKISDDKDMAKNGLVVWAINIKEEKPEIQKFLTDNKYSFTVLMDAAGDMLKNYFVSGIPTTFVVGRDGTVKNVFVGFGGADTVKQIDDAVAKALAEPAPK